MLVKMSMEHFLFRGSVKLWEEGWVEASLALGKKPGIGKEQFK